MSSFIRNAWYIVGWADEVTAAPLARRICNEPIVVFRDGAGKAAALSDRCCHRGTPLSLGEMVESGIQCGYHGLVFDTTGRCVHVPGQDRIPEKARVPAYPLVEKDALLWIWVGEAEKADPSLIIDLPQHNDPRRWPHRHDVYHIAGSYLLMVDNLMDLTHLGYVHKKTIGGNPAAHVGATMETTRTETGLKFTRWMMNSTPPPTYVNAYGFTGKVDRWQEFEFIAPGSVKQWTGALDAGAGAAEGKRDGGFQFHVFHGLSPETATSCHYFWSTATGYRQDEPEACEQFFRDSGATFLEDKVVVEQQQARLDEFGEDWLVNIASDGARAHMRRVIERMRDPGAATIAAE
jgi:phenylpropionate dioxygenase-like ring-hydroxylating dioxygenase large terminal subunit